MDFPLNQIKLDSSYLSAVEDDADETILARYAVFKKLSVASVALVKSFNEEIDNYGSLKQTLRDILKKYHKLLSELFENYKNLREDLQRHVNKNSKFLEEISQNGGHESFFYKIALRRQEKLCQKIVYLNGLHKFYRPLSRV